MESGYGVKDRLFLDSSISFRLSKVFRNFVTVDLPFKNQNCIVKNYLLKNDPLFYPELHTQAFYTQGM